MSRFIALLITLLCLAACTAEPQTIIQTVEVPVTAVVTAVSTVEVTRLVEVPVEVEVTRVVETEVTREVEVQVVVTQTPPPQPADFLNLTGQGDVVSDNFDWQPCDKAVFIYDTAGTGNLIIRLHKIGVEEARGLVNEIGPVSGEVLQGILGGTYYVTVNGPAGGWTLKAECRD